MFSLGCGAVYTAEEGVILSPGYPFNYGNNLDCNYTISVEPQKYVILTFDPDHFNIEGGNFKPNDRLGSINFTTPSFGDNTSSVMPGPGHGPLKPYGLPYQYMGKVSPFVLAWCAKFV